MPLNEQEKDALRKHLPYELTMLDYAFIVAGAEANGDKEKLQRLAAIDNFYMHARCLIEFYQNTYNGSKATAMVFTEPQPQYPSFADFSDALNDQVVHIGWARGEYAAMLFDGANRTIIHSRLATCLTLFQNHLTEEARQVWQRRESQTIYVTDNTIPGASSEIFDSLSKSGSLTSLIADQFVLITGSQAAVIMVPAKPPSSNN
jgi:hypothetical protein